MKINNEKGVALAMTLFLVVVLLGLSAVFVLRTINEAATAERELEQTKAFYVAEGAANSGLEGLDTLINDYLLNTVTNANPNTVISVTNSYVGSNDGIGWLQFAVRDNGTQVLILNGSQAEYSQNGTLGEGTFQYDIVITEKTDPVAVTSEIWEFPFSYEVMTSNTAGLPNKQILLAGDFTVQVKRDNFAKYALFTNSQTTPLGSNVWFTDSTNFAGPLHTNGRYNIYGNPSGTFEGHVGQHEQEARFYNNGSPFTADWDSNPGIDEPTWNGGFDRGEPSVTLNSPVVEQDMIDQATAGNTYSSDGIYVPNDGSNLTGGIYVRGNADVVLNSSGGNPRYTIVQGGRTQHITIDKSAGTTTIDDSIDGVSVYNGEPKGVDGLGTLIFVDGDIDDLHGTVHSSEEVTVASSDDIKIQDHITYTDYTPAVGTPGQPGYVPPSADGASNLLGIVSWNGDVRIDNGAPNDVNIHGTILASNGVYTVDNYYSGSPRGTATTLGGVISDNYGAFGTFNGSTGEHVSGYGRNFVYDERMLVGSAPPYFPTLQTFIAFTNDITDKMVWQEGGS